MHVAAAQEGNPIQDLFLEPFERKINDGSDVKSNELRDDQSTDNDKAERTP